MSRRWFKDVFGLKESQDYEQVRAAFRIEETADNKSITLHTSERTFHVGPFEVPSVAELRSRLESETTTTTSKLSFKHIIGDVWDLHHDDENHGAVFQAASQFNCLEMMSPQVTPEEGITDYILDRTQGPACAMACPAGTLYRNYFVNETGQGGHGQQLNLLSDIDEYLNNTVEGGVNNYWNMENGYVLPSKPTSIKALRKKLESRPRWNCGSSSSTDSEQVDLSSLLRVGVHSDTEVAKSHQNASKKQHVTQVYCSALPIGYDPTGGSDRDWEPFAQPVLHGAYEATIAVAAILARRRGGARTKVFLTKVGGGVFGNSPQWIEKAIGASLNKYRSEPLDVMLVHFGILEPSYVSALPTIVASK